MTHGARHVRSHSADTPQPECGIEVDCASPPGQDAAADAGRAGLPGRRCTAASNPRRQARLAARRRAPGLLRRRRACRTSARTPRAIREGDWRWPPLPAALLDRRVEITGPVDPKMVINALNSGAKVLHGRLRGFAPRRPGTTCSPASARCARRSPARSTAPRRTAASTTRSSPFDEQAVLIVRPRGWHLDEKHVLRRRRRRSSASPVRPRPVRLPQRARARGEGSRPVLLPAQAAVDGRSGAVGRRAGAHRSRARPAAGPDQGHGADRDAAGGVRDGRDPARAARRASSASTAGAGTTSFRTSRPSARHRDRVLPERGAGHDDAAVPQGLFGTADPDLPPARRACDGRHGRADSDQRRRRRQRSGDGARARRQAARSHAPATTAPGSRIRR